MQAGSDSGGTWFGRLSNRNYELVSFPFGGPDCLPIPADYDCDGLADPALYQGGTGLLAVLLSGRAYAYADCLLGGPGYVEVNAQR
jgi:hypothetical protein